MENETLFPSMEKSTKELYDKGYTAGLADGKQQALKEVGEMLDKERVALFKEMFEKVHPFANDIGLISRHTIEALCEGRMP